MKKAIMSLCLAAALVFGAAGVQAADQDKGNNPVLQFTGSVWQKSSLDNKLSFLFGMDTAIATEYFVNSREVRKGLDEGVQGREAHHHRGRSGCLVCGSP